MNGRDKNITTIQQDEHDANLNAKTVIDRYDRHTSFNERVTAIRSSRFNPKLTWGLSELRDNVIATGSGTVTESDGAGVISTGTTPSSTIELRTKERGQYQSGAEGEAGMGIRVASGLITDNKLQTGEEIRWQYCDNTFGFGYGIDETGIFVFRVNDGSFSKVYQSNWNKDTADGSASSSNPSGINLDLEEGNIFQINFVWYGHGSIDFYLNLKDDTVDNRLLIHTIQVSGELSVKDPNQPISIVAQNGSGGRDLIVYVGGRQFSIVNGDSKPNTRSTIAEARKVALTDETTYVPVLGVRKKTTFNGRANSVNCFFKAIDIVARDNSIEWYMSVGDTLDGTWGAIPLTPTDETALEQTDDSTEPGSTQYRKFLAGTVDTGNEKSTILSEESSLSLGGSLEFTFWARPISATNAEVDVFIDVEEEW